jgi:AhpD family alkylhydroperoxidase
MPQTTIHTLDTAPEASRRLLENSIKASGRLPSLHAVMATSPGLLEGYQVLHRLAIQATAFTPEERTVVWMTVNVANRCHYCVPAHTGIAKREKIDDAIIDALRDETPLADPRLEALRTFTLAVRDTHGRPSADQLAAFEAAGFDDRAILRADHPGRAHDPPATARGAGEPGRADPGRDARRADCRRHARKQAKMRVGQIWQWIYQWGVRDFGAMTNLAKAYRALLAETFVIEIPEVVSKQVSRTARASTWCASPAGTRSRSSTSPRRIAARCACRARSAAR